MNYALKSGKLPEFALPLANTSSDSGDLLAATNALLGSTLETKEVILGLSRSSDDTRDKQSSIWRHLSSIEQKVSELEKEVNDPEFSQMSDSFIKNQISLMFLDLKNAKTLT